MRHAMNEKYAQIVEEIIAKDIAGGVQCPKDFKCTKFEFEDLCRAVDIGKENCLECMERKTCDCPFAIDIGYARLCRCPLRIYISKNMQK